MLLFLVCAAYLPVLWCGFVWDDDSWTTRIAPLLHDSAGLRAIWARPTALQQYYPLSATTFWLDYQLWKLWAAPYHVENVLLHALAALLFWRLLRQLGIRSAWLASALFALHPVMVESVAWITQRKNVLSLVLSLEALLMYLRYERTRPNRKRRELRILTPEDRPLRMGRDVSYLLAWLLFLAALLAKTAVCPLPGAILLLAWWRRGRLDWRRDILPTLPFFAVALGMCTVTAWLEKNHVGAQGPDFALTLGQRCLVAGRAFWFYLGKLLWPVNLCFVYPRWQPNVAEWRQWLYPAAALVVTAALWLARGRIGRAPAATLFLYLGMLFPVLGFLDAYFMRYSFVCDHWSYLPSLGLATLAASGLDLLWRRCGKWGPFFRPTVGAMLLVLLGGLTYHEVETYRDSETLWRTTIARNPDCWMAYVSLGNIVGREGRLDEAVYQYKQALRLKPDLAEAYTSLAAVAGRGGQTDEAIGLIREAIRLRPDYAEAHYNLGLALARKGDVDDAIFQFQEAIRLKPRFPLAYQGLDAALRRNGRADARENAERP